MAKIIFHSEHGSIEKWLEVRDDGKLLYVEENSGWDLLKHGVRRKEVILSVEEAKTKWPRYAEEIEKAIKAP